MGESRGKDVPFEEQREMYALVSQETRHLILQYILAHPHHLPSLDELDYLIPKNKASIRDQLEKLKAADIVEQYDHSPNATARDLPSQFYGLSERGVDILHAYNYLRGVPLARALYDRTRLSEQARRHRDAPRPALPDAVARPLRALTGAEGAGPDVRTPHRSEGGAGDRSAIARYLYENDVGPAHPGVTAHELGQALDVELASRPRTHLATLRERDVVEAVRPAGESYRAIDARTDRILRGDGAENPDAQLERLIAHIDDELHSADVASGDMDDPEIVVAVGDGAGTTVRAILASAFGVEPDAVGDHLRSGDPLERLTAALDAIEASPAVEHARASGRILFVSRPTRYRLTEAGVASFEQGAG